MASTRTRAKPAPAKPNARVASVVAKGIMFEFENSKRYKIPCWVAIIVWPAQLLLVYVGLPTNLANLGPRHGWRRGRPGLWNLFGLALLVPNIIGLGLIAFRHLASSSDTIKTPQPAPPYLLTDGLYQRSRNPMCVAGIGTWIGWTLHYGNLAVMTGTLIFWLAIARIAVPYEKRALEARFGDAYIRYKAAVPRWMDMSRSL
jgi:protein-S-isoprenylcysteine O-methyltransferase Ste14